MAISFCNHRTSIKSNILYRETVNSIKKELFRKSIHVCSAFLPFLLDKLYWLTITLLSLVLVVYIISEFLRLKGKPIVLISTITAVAARKRDENKFVLGPVTLSLGILLTALIFEPLPAACGILALSFGDGLASLFGKMFGHITIPFTSGKTVAGSLTCYIAIFCTTFLVCRDIKCAFIAGFFGMFVEVFPLKNLDNIAIPILIASLIQFYCHI